MTESELRAKFEAAYKIIQRERKMRAHVFRHDPFVRAAKLDEMDKLLTLVTEIKDLAKLACEPSPEQPPLLDMPHKADYA